MTFIPRGCDEKRSADNAGCYYYVCVLHVFESTNEIAYVSARAYRKISPVGWLAPACHLLQGSKHIHFMTFKDSTQQV